MSDKHSELIARLERFGGGFRSRPAVIHEVIDALRDCTADNKRLRDENDALRRGQATLIDRCDKYAMRLRQLEGRLKRQSNVARGGRHG